MTNPRKNSRRRDTPKTDKESKEKRIHEGRSLLKNEIEKGKALLRKINKWMKKKMDETKKYLKGGVKMKRRKPSTGEEEMKGGGMGNTSFPSATDPTAPIILANTKAR